jgi:hypothetical protein
MITRVRTENSSAAASTTADIYFALLPFLRLYDPQAPHLVSMLSPALAVYEYRDFAVSPVWRGCLSIFLPS